MACEVKQGELADYVAGRLTGPRRQWLQDHIEHCRYCQERLAHFKTVRFSQDHEAPGPPDFKSITEQSLGNYRILEEIGRGGMGRVYKAEQKSPHRIVALKVMRLGVMSTDSDRRRFDREAEAMAQFQHPGIVPIYEYGEVDGTPYFSMEYVEGLRLDDYCQANHLNIRQRLLLMQNVCEAVAYAHQRGVIHRDLKPANIMVSPSGQGRILDFGLAKVLHDEEQTQAMTELTADGQVLGTLAYMAPEQTGGNPAEVDVRTDVYSLGVILYRLLTGEYPYDITGAPLAVIDRICSQDPKRPRTIDKSIDSEVEAIILKALSKEKERRYTSADALGEDIRRYLAGEPVTAKGTSSAYVAKKMLRRHWQAAVAVGFSLAVLIAVSGREIE